MINITDDTPIFFSGRRAFEGFCPEKQVLLTEMRQLLFKGTGEDRLIAIYARLMDITFTPTSPGESRQKE